MEAIIKKIELCKEQITHLENRDFAKIFGDNEELILLFDKLTEEQLNSKIVDLQAIIEREQMFIDLAEINNFVISKSPFSNSYYAHSENDTIDWGLKPVGSYRLSNHWNWTSNGTTHCPTVTNRDFGEALAIMTENGYEQIA